MDARNLNAAAGGRQLALAVAVLLPAGAQALAPSFDCAAAEGAVERAICASDALASMDLELARLYRLALDGPHMTAAGARELEATRRDWLAARDACAASPRGLEACVAASYADRIHALRAGYADVRTADAGASVGPVAFRCDGLADPVSAVFVNTEAPMVSVAWGDDRLALPLARSGSGARYAADDLDGGPATFWEHQGDAQFAPPGQDLMSCVREPTG